MFVRLCHSYLVCQLQNLKITIPGVWWCDVGYARLGYLEQLSNRLVLEKLSRKVACLFGNRRFITVFRGACHWTLFWIRLIHFASSHAISVLRNFSIYSSVSEVRFSDEIIYTFLISHMHATYPTLIIFPHFITSIIFYEDYRI
jgi:hypothetical protein